MDSQNKELNGTRRQFLTHVGLCVVAVEAISSLGHARNSQEIPPEIVEKAYLKIVSSNGVVPHRHDLYIPLELLRNPPREGLVLRTEKTAYHWHPVRLTYEQVLQIQEGFQVLVYDGNFGEHDFLIYIPELQNGSRKRY